VSGTCPQPPAVAVAATLSAVWNPPGVNGGTYPITLCYIQLTETNPIGYICGGGSSCAYTYTGTELQSVVLPNGTGWTFNYTTDGYADLAQITFPTGGTISYGGYGNVYGVGANALHRAAATRTFNPNNGVTPASVWSYNYMFTGTGPTSNTTIVSAPPSVGSTPDDTVHTFTELSGPPSTVYNTGYETTTQFYHGSHTSGSLLKTVNKTYSWMNVTSYYTGDYPLGVIPKTTTTMLANGQENETSFTYDSSLSYYPPYYIESSGLPYTGQGWVSSAGGTYGRPLYKYEYDYGNGAPGSLLRTTTTTYLALSNSAYLSANLFDLASSVELTGSGPAVYTLYGYDAAGGSSWQPNIHGPLAEHHEHISNYEQRR